MSLEDHRQIPVAEPALGSEERERVREVLDSGMIADGEEVRAFEREFATTCHVDRGVATSNGTTALHTALRACGIGEGDTVVTTPFSFVATANAVRFCGAEPVFADIDPDTYNLDPTAVREAIEIRGGDVDAVLPVHLYGLPAPMDEIAAIAEEYDAAVVEDAAQAHGARYRDEPVGSLGDAAAFSFYPTKNMTTGEGGMVVTDDEAVADRAERFVNHGRNERYDHVELGHNFRMTNIAAAIGRVQLKRLSRFVRARRDNAAALTEALAEAPVDPPTVPDGVDHAFHQYTVRAPDRERLVAHLDDHGIDTGVYYPTPIHEQPAYEGVDERFPVAERAAAEVVSLPVHPGVSEGDRGAIADALALYQPQ
ncbi:DegT/DnrJ/EryC1/StrS family aminotransferase [Halosimplex rubrum]|uniref:DegT/DnrJ/EryC1/StrS family aminotransferase n=1 Tax=Halosimplex rubrum TaxID=869889 RepID=A0A7D5P9N1_9EURY|nr:DegT/DnrJ/EryC1/StrS family aminotransferase [Halosimplex rubrum]QLH77780.1 DegT/DnrJ/EryC1/StrS family aminotransferase [Halosimplex rubrum]